METDMRKRFWRIIVLLLLAVTIIGVLVAWTKYRPGQPIEIILPTTSAFEGSIQISGAVISPGIYPYTEQDSIGGLIQSAGGATATVLPAQLELTVPAGGNQPAGQKINVNRAEVWLLEALPGIGEVKAKAIVAYRESHGPFKLTSDLMKVEGIGEALFGQIKDLVSVTD